MKTESQRAFQRGKQARQLENITDAIKFFKDAIQLKPDFIAAYNNLANALQANNQLEQAVAVYQQALKISPNTAILHCNFGSLRQIQAQPEQAIACYQQAIKLQPDLVMAHHNLAKILATQEQFSAADSAYQTALKLQPDAAKIHFDRGCLYHQTGFIEQAIQCYKAAIRLQPTLLDAYNNLGGALKHCGDIPKAKSCYQKALTLDADDALAHFYLSQVLAHEGELDAALYHCERSLAVDSDRINAHYHLNDLRLRLVDWQDYEQRVAALITRTEAHLTQEKPAELSPMILLMFPAPIELLRKVAEQRSQAQARSIKWMQEKLPKVHLSASPERLRIGYVSPDFRQHAVGSLICAMFQYHQRPEFEIFAYSLVPTQDDCSDKIRQYCDHFVDLWQQSPLQIAQRVQSDGIHILMDLAGHTANSCTALFALRPAPIQIQYLGYPGTMGADYIPYILADEQLIPSELASHYSEEVIYLPHAWVASPMQVAAKVLQRSDYGLPEQGTIFCCFNRVQKIDPMLFAVWMRILKQVPGSVLWLFDGENERVSQRLKQRAIALGVAAERLIFMAFLSHEEYLANYQLADLFLDTFRYNAGATAVGALSVGLPVLTCPGENYASRMGASVCHAVGLDELVCATPDDYERTAVKLGNQPEEISKLKQKLAQNLTTSPLFQPRQFVQTLEKSYRTLWQKHHKAAQMNSKSETALEPETTKTKHSAVSMQGSEHLYQWLNDQKISLAFTTYQTNRLFLVGCNDQGHLAVDERLFDKPMGLYAKDNSLYMATRYQIWQLENRLGVGELYQGRDRLYVPSQSHTTGDLNVHDVVLDSKQKLLFINTDFSCLATLQDGFSFAPIWQPPFISKLAAEDRCHLNGLAMQDGEPTFVTACSATDEPAGWRNHRTDGGIVMHIPSNEIIASGLSMPHSPRWYQGKLWLLNSGSGELGYLDDKKFMPITFCPGFVRGLAFWENYALVGLSKLRSASFGGLELEKRLIAENKLPQCGLMVIDLNDGKIVHQLHIEGAVEELFDIVVLPDVRQPKAFGFQNEDIDRCVNFPDSNGMIITKPTLKRSTVAQPPSVSGLPRLMQTENSNAAIKYQQVYHLTPENLLAYEAMTNPSLKKHWQTHPQRGELIGISASVAGDMIGFAIAERWQENEQRNVELLSSHVLPAYRHQNVAATLVKLIQKAAMT